MASTFYIKQDDTGPILTADLKDAAEAAIDLTGASVRFHMRATSGGTPKVDAAATVVSPATSGVVEYPWVTGDTDTPGKYDAEFEVTYSGGDVETFPNDGYITVIVLDDLA